MKPLRTCILLLWPLAAVHAGEPPAALTPVRQALYGSLPATAAPSAAAPGLTDGTGPENGGGSRTRTVTFWTVTSLGIACGIGGLANTLGTAGAYETYSAATISYEAERLGNRLDRVKVKALQQLTLSAFFLVISAMMSMDTHFGG